MLAIIILSVAVALFFRVLGFSLRIAGRVIGGLVSAAIMIAVIGGMFGIVGLTTGAVRHLLPVAVLIGIGILIGRRISRNPGTVDSIRNGAQNLIDGCHEHVDDFINRRSDYAQDTAFRGSNGFAQDTYYGSADQQQDIVDINGRVIR